MRLLSSSPSSFPSFQQHRPPSLLSSVDPALAASRACEDRRDEPRRHDGEEPAPPVVPHDPVRPARAHRRRLHHLPGRCFLCPGKE
jgi:hypothetical protein